MPSLRELKAAVPACPKAGLVPGERCGWPLRVRAGAWWCPTHERVVYAEALAPLTASSARP